MKNFHLLVVVSLLPLIIRQSFKMSEKKKKVKSMDLPESGPLGDLSPTEDLKGPKAPSNRQVLRFFLFLISLGQSLNDAADTVVQRILDKHPTTSVSKTERRLREDVKNIYTEAK